jgi:methyl-accepting chemotaxis protein
MNKSIATKVYQLLGVFIALLVIQAGILFYQTNSVTEESTKLMNERLPLLLKAKDLQMSVVQVQQWLTDISATRGLDGLDDGFDVAKEQAESFHQIIDRISQLDPAHQNDYQALKPIFDNYYETGITMATAYVEQGPAGGNGMMESFDNAASAINSQVDTAVQRIVQTVNADLQHEVESSKQSQLTVLAIFLGCCLFTFLALRFTRSAIITPLYKLRDTVKGLASQEDNDIQPVSLSDLPENEIGQTYLALNELIEKLQAKAAEERAIATENGRIKKALDVCHANVMVADTNLNIIYHNDALVEMMEKAAEAIQTQLPNFDPHTLVGSNIDQFHYKPEKQRNMLAKLTSPYTAQIDVGGRIMILMVTPVIDNGQREGFVVEWEDITEERNIEDQIQSLVSDAAHGNLTNRIDLSDKSGFFKRLASELNDLMDVTDTALHDVVSMLSKMSQGDLSNRLDNNYQGVFGQLCGDANNMVEKLTSVVSDLSNSSENVATSANELASANNALQARTESQAAGLDQTASSMEEITATVQQTSANASNVADMINNAAKTAHEGEQSVGKVVEAMDSIQEASGQIDKIIVVIDEIAFQTNLLALNAAVEAARAGESGRSFAVVASEVRNLAQRSAAAAGNIKSLITDSVKRVNVGVERVQHSGEVLNELIGCMKEVKELVDTVSVATQEQSAGVLQINQTVSSLDEATQQNSALVEELAATASDLASQAGEVKQSLSFFKTQ